MITRKIRYILINFKLLKFSYMGCLYILYKLCTILFILKQWCQNYRPGEQSRFYRKSEICISYFIASGWGVQEGSGRLSWGFPAQECLGTIVIFYENRIKMLFFSLFSAALHPFGWVFFFFQNFAPSLSTKQGKIRCMTNRYRESESTKINATSWSCC